MLLSFLVSLAPLVAGLASGPTNRSSPPESENYTAGGTFRSLTRILDQGFVIPYFFIRSIGSNMKRKFVLCTLFLTALVSAYSQSSSEMNRQWITDVYIISPENLDHIEKGNVLIENGRIARVERNRKAKTPAGARVVDGHGQYLIPGLIDSHVHLASIPGMTSDQEATHGTMVNSYLKQMPRSYLYYGYTTLVDLGQAKVLDEFGNESPRPDLYDCGGSLPLANGYPMSFAPPGVRFKPFSNFIYDPKQADRIPPEYKPEDHTPAADVARVKARGGICVKTYFERGFADDKNLPVITPEMLAQIRAAATDDGLVLMIHANSFEAQKFAAAGNVDVIAHGLWNWGSLDQSPELPDEMKRLLDEIVEKKIGYQPTMQVLYGLAAYFDPEYLKNPAVAKVAPKAMLEWFESPEGKWFGKELNDDDTPAAVVAQHYEQGPLRRVRQVVQYLANRNANFLFGTDTPSSPTYGNLPGLNGFLEMKQLQKAGLSLKQIFRAATISNAGEFKMESQIGSIEPGKAANLVLMRKSPLETVDAYDTITSVWVHGKELPRETLAADAKE
jgi:imidazolonepropionase-like amidohydrolase